MPERTACTVTHHFVQSGICAFCDRYLIDGEVQPTTEWDVEGLCQLLDLPEINYSLVAHWVLDSRSYPPEPLQPIASMLPFLEKLLSAKPDDSRRDASLEIDRRGEKLDTDDLETCQQLLQQDPDHLVAHILLIGYHSRRDGRTPEDDSSLVDHLTWLIEKHPLQSATTIYGARRRGAVGAGDKIAEAWNRQVARHPNDPAILGRATMFFLNHDLVRAEELIHQLNALNTPDRSYSGLFANLYERHYEMSTGAKRAMAAKRALQVVLEEEAEREERSPETNEEGDERISALHRSVRLQTLAPMAFDAAEYSRAREYAEELLAITKEHGRWLAYWNPGATAHGVLGRLAIVEGDLREAKAHLAAMLSARRGPLDLTLAQELLEAGEREAVWLFLLSYRSLDRVETDDVNAWIEAIQSGLVPNMLEQKAPAR